MARQAKLFPEPATTIKVDQARAGPRLWVRRLGGSDPRGCRSGVASTLSGRPILERLPPIFVGIEGSRLLNEEGHDYLLSLDRNTIIVFHWHHGIRSQAAAEYFLREAGFRNLYNVRVGIDA